MYIMYTKCTQYVWSMMSYVTMSKQNWKCKHENGKFITRKLFWITQKFSKNFKNFLKLSKIEMLDFRLDSSEIRKIKIFEFFLLKLLRIKNELGKYVFTFGLHRIFGIFQKPISKNVARLSTLKNENYQTNRII